MELKVNALVLLGVSGSGKDTIASQFPSSTNIKFAALTKEIVARVWGVDADKLEDKEWRNESSLLIGGKQISLSPFDLLSALYHGAPYTKLSKANIELAIEKAKASSFPIFTDVRRVLELEAVVQHFFPYVVLLRRPFTFPSPNDKETYEAFEWAINKPLPAASLHNNFPADHIADKIKFLINRTNDELKQLNK